MSERVDAEPVLITDFSAATDLGWFVVNDNVMGGRSSGSFYIHDAGLVFSGSTNTDGGGFSSIRSRSQVSPLNGYTAIIVTARGDGRRYVLRLECDGGIAYWADFEPSAGCASPTRVPLSSFRPRFRGRWLDGPPLKASAIETVGFMCYDGRDGPFCLEVKRIEAV